MSFIFWQKSDVNGTFPNICLNGYHKSAVSETPIKKQLGEETMDLTSGNFYKCIGEITSGPQKGYLFIIDESGEDYIYSPDFFSSN